MKEIKILDESQNSKIRCWLRENKISHCWFSEMNIIAFTNNEDAFAFILIFGGKNESAIEILNKRFERKY